VYNLLALMHERMRQKTEVFCLLEKIQLLDYDYFQEQHQLGRLMKDIREQDLGKI